MNSGERIRTADLGIMKQLEVIAGKPIRAFVCNTLPHLTLFANLCIDPHVDAQNRGIDAVERYVPAPGRRASSRIRAGARPGPIITTTQPPSSRPFVAFEDDWPTVGV